MTARLTPGLGTRPMLIGALASALASAAWLALAPLGGDQAAHAYFARVLDVAGFPLWDNFWYSGRYELINYSLLFYPIGRVLGDPVLATVCVVATTVAAAHLACRWTQGSAWLAALLGLSISLQLVIGQYPFALGAACAAWAGVALAHRRPLVATLAAVATLLASPLAFLFLVVALAGVALGRPAARRPRSARIAAAGLLATAGLAVLVQRAFPDGGTYPFSLADLARLLAFCVALVLVVRRQPRLAALGWVAVVYALVALALFVVPIGIGSNIERLANYLGLPVALVALQAAGFRPRLAGVVLMAVGISLQVMPAADALRQSVDDPAAVPGYWSGALHYLERHRNPNYRVEVVATSTHWESYYLAGAGIPLARGWFRQDDYPLNAVLYRPSISPAAYVGWLRSLGIAQVVVTDAPIDSSSQAELAVLARPSRLGLRMVYRDAHVRIYSLARPTPILTARSGTHAGSILQLSRSSLRLSVPRRGTYRLRIRFTPYWQVQPSACVQPSVGEPMTLLYAPRAGDYSLLFAPTASSAFEQVVGADLDCAGIAAPR